MGSWLDTFWFKQNGFPQVGHLDQRNLGDKRLPPPVSFAGLGQENIYRGSYPWLASLLFGGMLHISEVATTIYPSAFLQCTLTHVPLRRGGLCALPSHLGSLMTAAETMLYDLYNRKL